MGVGENDRGTQIPASCVDEPAGGGLPPTGLVEQRFQAADGSSYLTRRHPLIVLAAAPSRNSGTSGGGARATRCASLAIRTGVLEEGTHDPSKVMGVSQRTEMPGPLQNHGPRAPDQPAVIRRAFDRDDVVQLRFTVNHERRGHDSKAVRCPL